MSLKVKFICDDILLLVACVSMRTLAPRTQEAFISSKVNVTFVLYLGTFVVYEGINNAILTNEGAFVVYVFCNHIYTP